MYVIIVVSTAIIMKTVPKIHTFIVRELPLAADTKGLFVIKINSFSF